MTRVWFRVVSRQTKGVALLFLVAICAGWARPRAAESGCTLKWVTPSPERRFYQVEVSGLGSKALRRLRGSNLSTAEWQKILSVFVEKRDPMEEMGMPPMAGAYRIERGVIFFEPAYKLQPGVTYRAEFRMDTGPTGERRPGLTLASRLQVPRVASAATTRILGVHPDSDVLPENLLKFYIYFSGPMSRGHIYNHIHLRHASGAEVPLPFLEIDEELWDSTDSRLTLFIDPGRIKRGVHPLEEVGPALEVGKRFTLSIDREFRDGLGNPLKEGFEKTFEVSPADRDPPDPSAWKIELPRRLSRNPLTLIFPEAMDHALALRMIHVTDASGVLVPGKPDMGGQERRWRFTPTKPWSRGRFAIHIQTAIEDLAGNNIGKAFDVDLFEGVQKRFVNSTVRLPFELF